MMKFNLLLLFFLFPILLYAFSRPDSLEFNQRSAEYFPNGQLKKCKLKNTQIVENLPCRRWLKFHENGRIRQFELAENRVIQNINFPSRTIIWLRPDGTIDHCWLSKTMEIQGYRCKGGAWSKIDTGFHPNGKLRVVFIEEDKIIQNIPCRASVFHPVCFYPSGALLRCALSKTVKINQVTYKKGLELEFDEAGNVISN